MKDKKPTVALCASASVYKQLVEAADELERRGFGVIVPMSAREMQQKGDFSLSHQTWHTNPDDYPKKAVYIRAHFEEIERADAVLILNYDKGEKRNYIGGNVLMEIGIAFYLKKPIYILNEAPQDSPFLEEILASLPTFLHGKLENMPEYAN